MTEPDIRSFRARLRRIAKIHRRGGGFEAAGTLGQSYYTRQARRSARPVLRPMLYMIGAVILSKALLVASLGPDEYAGRVIALQSGNSVERVGALFMGVDPVTESLAELLISAWS